MTPELIFILSFFGLLWIAGIITTALSVNYQPGIPLWKKIVGIPILFFLWWWLALDIARRLP